MIEIKNLSFSYGKHEFIKDLCITLPDSSFTAIVGENGSGKTTLLSLISRELSARSGEIRIDGADINALSRNELARRLSIFPQGREIPDMTALELVTLGRYPYTKSKLTPSVADLDVSLSSLRRVGADKFSDRRLSSLSYGERQRVYLAMQLAQSTQSLLLDEPTNHLDISSKFDVMNLLTELKNEGKCVVAVLHDITLALQYADRIAIMKDGALISLGSPDEIYQSKIIEDAFGMRLIRFASEDRTVYAAVQK